MAKDQELIGSPFIAGQASTGWTLGGHPPDIPEAITGRIGRCVAFWPHIEHQFAMILSALIGGDAGAGVAIFSALKRTNTQFDIVRAVARTVLPEEKFASLGPLFESHRSVDEKRNCIAHGIWGRFGAEEDKAVWVQAWRYASFNDAALKSSPTDDHHRELEKQLRVVSFHDFDRIEKEFVAHLKNLWEWTTLLSTETGAFERSRLTGILNIAETPDTGQ